MRGGECCGLIWFLAGEGIQELWKCFPGGTLALPSHLTEPTSWILEYLSTDTLLNHFKGLNTSVKSHLKTNKPWENAD